jgi:hypothetical protein
MDEERVGPSKYTWMKNGLTKVCTRLRMSWHWCGSQKTSSHSKLREGKTPSCKRNAVGQEWHVTQPSNFLCPLSSWKMFTQKGTFAKCTWNNMAQVRIHRSRVGQPEYAPRLRMSWHWCGGQKTSSHSKLREGKKNPITVKEMWMVKNGMSLNSPISFTL